MWWPPRPRHARPTAVRASVSGQDSGTLSPATRRGRWARDCSRGTRRGSPARCTRTRCCPRCRGRRRSPRRCAVDLTSARGPAMRAVIHVARGSGGAPSHYPRGGPDRITGRTAAETDGQRHVPVRGERPTRRTRVATPDAGRRPDYSSRGVERAPEGGRRCGTTTGAATAERALNASGRTRRRKQPRAGVSAAGRHASGVVAVIVAGGSPMLRAWLSVRRRYSAPRGCPPTTRRRGRVRRTATAAGQQRGVVQGVASQLAAAQARSGVVAGGITAGVTVPTGQSPSRERRAAGSRAVSRRGRRRVAGGPSASASAPAVGGSPARRAAVTAVRA